MSELLGGKYEVLDLAGEGGMAKVYRGQTHGAAGFKRRVAIKRVLAPLTQNEEFLSMFVEEARVISELEHPNITQIHDFDRDRSGDYYLVLEWVDGLTLAQWQHAHGEAGYATPWPIVAAIGIEVLKGLHAAHARLDASGNAAPIFHRDVTPQNVMVTIGGIVKLTDFGLARAMDRSKMTKPGFVKGKIAYLAPELTYEAEPSARTDVFSVGVVLWEVLAGEKLFQGEDPLKVIGRIRDGKIPQLTDKRQDVPADLRSIVSRALALRPEERYPSALEMGRALAQFLRGSSEPTDSEEIARSVRWARDELRRLEESGATPDSNSEIDLNPVLELRGPNADGTPPEESIPLTRKKNSE